MKTPGAAAGLVVLCLVVACTPAATPTPTMPPPTPTRVATATPSSVGDYIPPDVPRCQGLKMLDHALDFEWAGVDAAGEGNWFYYHCDQQFEDLSNVYRPKMTAVPYEWGEINWVVRPEGTLGVYFNTVGQNWLYLWFLPNPSSGGGSYLIVAKPGETPLDLPCCK